MTSPFFSIIVPCYNRAQFLPVTIASIQNQLFTDFELILIDDGSKDNTQSVLKEIALKDDRLRLICQQNRERGAARNEGIKYSKGEYLLFFDSDDEMKPDYLANLHQCISYHPGYNFYAAKYNFIHKGKEFDSTMSTVQQGTHGVELVLKGNPFACNFCVRRLNPTLKLFEEDRSLATTEDWMFLVENLYSDEIYVFDFIGLLMHQHEGRSMQQNEILIERRICATERLLQKLTFTEKEKNILWAYTYHFCSVHAYLDHNRKQAINYLRKSANLLGWSKPWILSYFKYIVGRSAVQKITFYINDL